MQRTPRHTHTHARAHTHAFFCSPPLSEAWGEISDRGGFGFIVMWVFFFCYFLFCFVFKHSKAINDQT